MARSGIGTWRAGCGESRTSGSEGGPEKPTSREAGRALRSDPYTQINTWEGPLYLAAVMDVWSRRIVGWAMADNMRAELVVSAFEMAVSRCRPPDGLIHHSDHGSQYTSYTMGKKLRDAGVLASMGRVRTCYDNAVAESFFATLKKDLTNRRSWPTRELLRREVFEFIEGWYNPHRRHSSLGGVSPAEWERKNAPTLVA